MKEAASNGMWHCDICGGVCDKANVFSGFGFCDTCIEKIETNRLKQKKNDDRINK